MGTVKRAGAWIVLRTARALATKAATPLILAGTMALAGLGAATMALITDHQAPGPAVRVRTLDDATPLFCAAVALEVGHPVCHGTAGRRSMMPNLGCTYDFTDQDGDLFCFIPAARPLATPYLGCYARPDGDRTYVCFYVADATVEQ